MDSVEYNPRTSSTGSGGTFLEAELKWLKQLGEINLTAVKARCSYRVYIGPCIAIGTGTGRAPLAARWVIAAPTSGLPAYITKARVDANHTSLAIILEYAAVPAYIKIPACRGHEPGHGHGCE